MEFLKKVHIQGCARGFMVKVQLWLLDVIEINRTLVFTSNY